MVLRGGEVWYEHNVKYMWKDCQSVNCTFLVGDVTQCEQVLRCSILIEHLAEKLHGFKYATSLLLVHKSPNV
jgi:hypothetical protein